MEIISAEFGKTFTINTEAVWGSVYIPHIWVTESFQTHPTKIAPKQGPIGLNLSLWNSQSDWLIL